MSRVGKKVITLDAKVSVDISDSLVSIKGPKGELSMERLAGIGVPLEDGKLMVSRDSNTKSLRSQHGLVRAVLQNMVTGVVTGFTRILEIQGVGYRAEIRGKDLVMDLGHSRRQDGKS